MMAHKAATLGATPLGTSTRAIASPSGMLCRASVPVTNIPSRKPSVPPNETPIPTPSLNECYSTDKFKIIVELMCHISHERSTHFCTCMSSQLP